MVDELLDDADRELQHWEADPVVPVAPPARDPKPPSIREAAVLLIAVDAALCDGMNAEHAVEYARRIENAVETDPTWANGRHEGDCTKTPMTCSRCHLEEMEDEAERRYEGAAMDALLPDDDSVCGCLDETGERYVELVERCVRCGQVFGFRSETHVAVPRETVEEATHLLGFLDPVERPTSTSVRVIRELRALLSAGAGGDGD